MAPDQSLEKFQSQIQAAGKSLPTLLPEEGFHLLLSFYQTQRAEGCDLQSDGDMLLYQWGTYSFSGTPETFQLNLTRQFMLQDEGEPLQLSLTFHFPPTPVFKALGSGNQWCSTPDNLPEFRNFIQGSPAYQAVAKSPAQTVELDFQAC